MLNTTDVAGGSLESPVGAPHFHWHQGELYVEDLSVASLAAQYGTPLFIYSNAALISALNAYQKALGERRGLICYGMKANSSLAILQLLSRAGAGFDIVSGGELARALAVGADPKKIVFSGVGKSVEEMAAGLRAGIKCFNVESLPELDRLSALASSLGLQAPVSLRINPDVDPKTHPYISTGLKDNKFGIAFEDALQAYLRARDLPGLQIVGVDYHIGSQITELAPFLDALDRLLFLLTQLSQHGIVPRHLDLGGGLGIRYRDENPPSQGELLGQLMARLDAAGHSDKEVMFEPGRSLVGNAGLLVSRVEFLKPGASRNFAIIDAAMNDLLRPTLYEAWHQVLPVQPRVSQAASLWDLVGPICESGDWLAKDRSLALGQGDLVAFSSAGAYGMSMASNYNTRGRAAEVLVNKGIHRLIRRRETLSDLLACELPLPPVA